MKRTTSRSLIGCRTLVEKSSYLLCFPSANRHGVVKQSCCVSQALVGPLLKHLLNGRWAQAASRIEHVMSRTNSCLSRRDLYGAMVRQRCHRTHFIEGQFARVVNDVDYVFKCPSNQLICVIARLNLHLIAAWLRANQNESFHHAVDFSDCDFNGALCSSEAILNTGRCQGSFDPLILLLFSLARPRGIESDHDRATRSDCGGNVPNVFRRLSGARNDLPYKERGQESDRKQQPDERQLGYFPSSLHASPDLDFWAIVACRQPIVSVRSAA